MQSLLAIARLTSKAAFRFRLTPLMGALLIGCAVLLPVAIKSDGTARGMTQIVLAYTLTLTTALLGMTTLWLACGTLAKDIEECRIQLVDVKPVPRWKVWLGKWLGILKIDLTLLALAAGVVYVELQWRASKLPPDQQEILRNEVFVARGSFKPPQPDIEAEVDKLYQQRLQQEPALKAMDPKEVRRALRARVLSEYEAVPPGWTRRWRIDMSSVKDKVRGLHLFLRIKFHAAERKPKQTYIGEWRVGPPESPLRFRDIKSQAPDTYHEFAVPPGLLDDKGFLTIEFSNPNETALLFPLDDGIEVLYREGGFLLNYVRGVTILFFWLALLAALGLASASYLSFPTAAFVSLSLLIVAFSTGTMRTVIEQGSILGVNPETGRVDNPGLVGMVSVAFFKTLLFLVNLVRGFSPIDSLSAGRSVSWGALARAAAQIVLLMGGFLAAVGIAVFTRRELATAQGRG